MILSLLALLAIAHAGKPDDNLQSYFIGTADYTIEEETTSHSAIGLCNAISEMRPSIESCNATYILEDALLMHQLIQREFFVACMLADCRIIYQCEDQSKWAAISAGIPPLDKRTEKKLAISTMVIDSALMTGSGWRRALTVDITLLDCPGYLVKE
jgi:hypothetical protein